MDGCKARPSKDGFTKPCPLRDDCARYALHLSPVKPNGYQDFLGPYDFDDEECGKYVER